MDWKQHYAIINKNKKRWIEICPTLNDDSGIYILTRTDEENKNYAYIGQSVHLLQRLAEHLVGYQHIDLSLKKHGIYCESNKYGWNVDFFNCKVEMLNIKEQEYIAEYQSLGYELRNKTAGGQGKGKVKIAEFKQNGYKKGVEYGKQKTIKEIKVFFEKYLDVIIKDKINKTKERKLKEFKELIGVD